VSSWAGFSLPYSKGREAGELDLRMLLPGGIFLLGTGVCNYPKCRKSDSRYLLSSDFRRLFLFVLVNHQLNQRIIFIGGYRFAGTLPALCLSPNLSAAIATELEMT